MKFITYGVIFIYNICVISLNASVFDRPAKKYQLLILIGHGMIDCPEQFEPDVLFCNVGFIYSKCYEECIGSLGLLPSRNFAAVF